MSDTTVTAQSIVDDSIARRKDTDKTTWSDSELLAYLNKGLDNISKMLIYLESEIAITETTVTLVASTQEYDLADYLPDFWAMAREGVYFSAVETPLTPIIYGGKIRNTSTTTDSYPTSYYVTSDKIGVVPIPTATAIALDGGDTLNCRYFKKPTTLTLTSTMPYNNIFNEPAAFFMDSLAMLRDEMNIAAYEQARASLESLVLKVVRYRNPVGPKALGEKM